MEFTDADSLQTFAKTVGKKAKPGTVIILTGDLGVGKTTFTQGLAKGLGIKGRVKSPSYALIKEYRDGRFPLFHMDVYRLNGQGGDDLFLEDYFEENGICVIEWGMTIQDNLPDDYLEIIISRIETNETSRHLQLKPHGAKSQKLIDSIEGNIYE